MRGFLVLNPDTPEEYRVENRICDEGVNLFLKHIFQDDDDIGATLYLGLMGADYDVTDGLADITGEPTHNTNGYARAALTRDGTDFPSIALVNGVYRVQSKLLTFTASGGDFDESVWRAFLCNAASGTTGELIAVTGAFSAARTITTTTPLPVRYEYWWQ